MSDFEDYSKRLLANFIAARLKAKRDEATLTKPTNPEAIGSPTSNQNESAPTRETIRRQNEASLPGRALYPLNGLGSSN